MAGCYAGSMFLSSSLVGRDFNSTGLPVVLGSVCMFTTVIPSLQIKLSQCSISSLFNNIQTHLMAPSERNQARPASFSVFIFPTFLFLI